MLDVFAVHGEALPFRQSRTLQAGSTVADIERLHYRQIGMIFATEGRLN
jgi:hypothetical protein